MVASFPVVQEQRLTGRIRVKRNWLGRIYIEVEIEYCTRMPYPHISDCTVHRKWRKMRLADNVQGTYTKENDHE